MGLKYLWDTNTAIYFLQQLFPPHAEHFIDATLKEGPPAISAITEIELLCWKTPKEDEIQILQAFINQANVLELEQLVKLKTVELRKKYPIKLPDAIIAATALSYNLTLITRNTKDFKLIPELTVVNPHLLDE